MTAPAPEKAAPIPAGQAEFDVLWPALRDRVGRGEIVALAKKLAADRASQEERIREDERLRFEGDLDRWMKTLGAGITGYQPEAYAVMDAACAELVRARDRIAALEAEASEGERLRAALRLIRLTDWSWPGGGSLTRVLGAQSRTASRALGLPEELPEGWPSDAEYEEIRRCGRALVPPPPSQDREPDSQRGAK